MLTTNESLRQGRYRIINCFRQDGKSAIYQAFDKVLDKNVLLKERADNTKKVVTVSQMEASNAAFADEAKLLTQINHETILHIHDYFSEIDRQYLVLENAEGSDLGELLKKGETSFSLMNVANWADQLLNALNYLHTHLPPIIHHDIKPQNLRLTSDGKIKLLAFVLGKISEAKAADSNPSQPLNYLPLEQIWRGLDSATQRVIANSYDEKSMRMLEQPADARSDIYSLGATLYHLLTGQLPVDALERSIEILENKPDPLLPPHQVNASIPPEISEVLMKSIEIKREKRFFSAAIMRQVLRTAFVRVKERESQTASKVENLLELSEPVNESPILPVAHDQKLEAQPTLDENKNSEDENRLAEKLWLEAEAEQKRKIEIVKQQLLEAKAKKIQAEQRAIELEKQRLEIKANDLRDKELLASSIKEPEFSQSTPILNVPNEPIQPPVQTKAEILPPTESITQAKVFDNPELFQKEAESFTEQLPPVNVQMKDVSKVIAPENSAVQFDELFAQPQKSNKIWRQMSVAAVVLLLLGGGIAGFWFLQTPATAGLNQINAEPTTVLTEKSLPEPKVESLPVLNTESTTEPEEKPTPALPPTVAEKTDNQPTVKTKPTPARTPKPTPQPAPTQAKTQKQPKTLTVEDLINN